ncbi:MAG TPA: hypothetical protein VNW71_04155 [Thermoanaerobaculia bacterium]|nr:hypothetical protein [Thermoanaerobaculia bacterium]
MGLRFRDLVMDVTVECLPGGPAPPVCGCTQTANAPACTKGSQNPNPRPRPNCPKPSASKPTKRLDGLGLLREQLRSELRG